MRAKGPTNVGRGKTQQQAGEDEFFLDIGGDGYSPFVGQALPPREPPMEYRHAFTAVHEGVDAESGQAVSKTGREDPMRGDMQTQTGENPATTDGEDPPGRSPNRQRCPRS